MRTKIQYFARCLFFAEICEPNGAHCATQTLKKKKKTKAVCFLIWLPDMLSEFRSTLS